MLPAHKDSNSVDAANNLALRAKRVARYDYDPFGHLLAAQGPLAAANPYRFSSKEQHAHRGRYCQFPSETP